MKKLFLIETRAVFAHRYAVMCDDPSQVSDATLETLREFSQRYAGEYIAIKREITKEEYLRMFDEDNDYLQGLDEDSKLDYINEKFGERG
jgi:hypothetical protein